MNMIESLANIAGASGLRCSCPFGVVAPGGLFFSVPEMGDIINSYWYVSKGITGLFLILRVFQPLFTKFAVLNINIDFFFFAIIAQETIRPACINNVRRQGEIHGITISVSLNSSSAPDSYRQTDTGMFQFLFFS
ncbi:MAG: hypothetical protein RBT34_04440 [Anaerolineaceae bacterium]|jgi:hypothetical protein|nr:hypothetical protein [Anaerolineaceae bacterium]